MSLIYYFIFSLLAITSYFEFFNDKKSSSIWYYSVVVLMIFTAGLGFALSPDWVPYVKAAVEGSSYYKLPRILQWVTGNIGFHHVHHLAPRVPNYKLEDAHESIKPLQQATTITIKTDLEI